jgi:D-glycero-D-manno-heptose 1,7-bisphosphate phosphatase
LVICSEAPDVVAKIAAAGYLPCVVTNQPDIARGLLTQAHNECIESKVRQALPDLNEYLVCPHDNAEGCTCRKPKPGLLTDFMEANKINPQDCWMVGDKWTDVLAGRNAGAKTILIRNSSTFSETSQGRMPVGLQPDYEVASLAEITEIILTAPPS